MKTAVVIPYFQRTAGILRRALISAVNQAGAESLDIIVIDDSSPIPADTEVATLSPQQRALIRVVRQPNGGPAAARNRGLDEITADTEIVAFLDSDDEWLPDHLARAQRTLEAGFDFYFANYFDIDAKLDGFTERGLLQSGFSPIPGVPDAFAYEADMGWQILEQCPIETSTVMFRRSAAADLRFRPEFRDAYEDLLFWFEVTMRTRRFSFSRQPECQYGKGINIFRGVTQGSEASLKRLAASSRFRRFVQRELRPNSQQKVAIANRLAITRTNFAAEILYRLRRRQPMLWRFVRQQLVADPLTLLVLVTETARRIRGPRGPMSSQGS